MWYPALFFFCLFDTFGSVFQSTVSRAVMPAPLAPLHQCVSDATYRNNLQWEEYLVLGPLPEIINKGINYTTQFISVEGREPDWLNID